MAGHTDNEVIIEAPLDVVWQMANDVEHWPELFVGEYAAAEILRTEPDRLLFRLTMVPDAQGVSRSWVSERVMDPMKSASSRRVETGPFLYMHIFQSFDEVDGGTRLRWVQDFEVLPTAPFTTEQMAERIDGNSKVQLARHKDTAEAIARKQSADVRS